VPPIAFPLFSRGRHIATVVFTFAPSRLVSTFAPSRLVVTELSALVGTHRARGRRPHRRPSRIRHRIARGLFFTRGDDLRPPAGVVFPRALRVPCPWRFGAPAGVVFLRALSSSARGSSSLHAARGHLLYPWRFGVSSSVSAETISGYFQSRW